MVPTGTFLIREIISSLVSIQSSVGLYGDINVMDMIIKMTIVIYLRDVSEINCSTVFFALQTILRPLISLNVNVSIAL